MTDKTKITITHNGPYKITGNIPLYNAIIESNKQGESTAWSEGKRHPNTPTPQYLCRCGQSHTKPFCDGAHTETKFHGQEQPPSNLPPYKENAELLKGETIDLLDDETLCIGARFCDAGQTTWNYTEPSADPNNREQAITQSCACPSGRLTAMDKNGTPIEPALPKEIGLIQDPETNSRGPLWVKGGIPVENADGEQYEIRNRVTLCRCGASRNQPFCDGAHCRVESMRGMDE